MMLRIVLDRDKPLQQQFYEQLRALIESGALKPGQRMPATRALADQYDVSRMTAVLSYERLVAEGLLHTVRAGGTFVSTLPQSVVAAAQGQPRAAPADAPDSPHDSVDHPDPLLFPTSRFRSLLRAALDRFGEARHARDIQNQWPLKTTIARWLLGSRGLDVSPDQVIIVSARQRALEIVGHLLLRPGQRVVCESPGDDLAAGLWMARGVRIMPVPVDEDGLLTDRLPGGPVALAHVTPSFHYPLGAILHPVRRMALLAWADSAGAHIVESDRVGDMRYDHEHPQALMGQDGHDRVLHIGDFTNLLGPWLRTAYLVVPPSLVGPAEAARRMIDEHCGGIELGVLAGFLESSAYPRHLVRARRVYAGRREAMVRALHETFGRTRQSRAAGGFALAWTPPPSFGPLERIAHVARDCALTVGIAPPLPSAVADAGSRVLLCGFARLTEAEIAERVAAWGRHLRHADWPILSRGNAQLAAD